MPHSITFKPFVLAAALVALSACSPSDTTPDDGAAAGVDDAEILAVTAALNDAQGNVIGQAIISETDGALTLSVTAEGLSPGNHGVHIHQEGVCTAPDFKSAGGHWNPRGADHGLENPAGAHSGDLPNMRVDANGVGTLTHDLGEGSIANGEFPLIDDDGAAMIVHAGEDDQTSNPSGNSGDRVACGVFAAL